MIISASSPGKVFILGEYAVLEGRPAVIASVGPRFRMKLDREGARGPAPHPQSPVSRLMDWAGRAGIPGIQDLEDLSLDFEDPFDGAGGFGSSTAQFALAYRVLSELSGG